MSGRRTLGWTWPGSVPSQASMVFTVSTRQAKPRPRIWRAIIRAWSVKTGRSSPISTSTGV